MAKKSRTINVKASFEPLRKRARLSISLDKRTLLKWLKQVEDQEKK